MHHVDGAIGRGGDLYFDRTKKTSAEQIIKNLKWLWQMHDNSREQARHRVRVSQRGWRRKKIAGVVVGELVTDK